MATKSQDPTLFAVLKHKTGSLTLGEHRITAQSVVSVPAAVRELACPESSPVIFHETVEAGEKALDKLKAEWARQPKQ